MPDENPTAWQTAIIVMQKDIKEMKVALLNEIKFKNMLIIGLLAYALGISTATKLGWV